MPYFKVHGRSRDSGRKRTKQYRATTKQEAAQRAVADGCEIELIEEVPGPRASEAQVSYAISLGVKFKPDVSMEEMSALISQALGGGRPTDELRFRAWRLGVPCDEFTARDFLESEVEAMQHLQRDAQDLGVADQVTWDRRSQLTATCLAYRWVFSVARHVFKARWVRFCECTLRAELVLALAQALLAEPALMLQIQEQSEGWDDDFDDMADAAGVNSDATPKWYFFGEDGASTRIKAYKLVAGRLRTES